MSADALIQRLADAVASTAERRPPKPSPVTVVATEGPTGHVWCAKPATVDEDAHPVDDCSLPAWHRRPCLPGVRAEPLCRCGACLAALYGTEPLDDDDLGYLDAPVRPAPTEPHRTPEDSDG